MDHRLVVSIGVIVLRRKRPDLKRAFRVPLSPWLPAASALICTYLMLNLTVETWLRFLVWVLLGLVVFFLYSRSHSRLQTGVAIRPDMLQAMAEGMVHPDVEQAVKDSHDPTHPDDLR